MNCSGEVGRLIEEIIFKPERINAIDLKWVQVSIFITQAACLLCPCISSCFISDSYIGYIPTTTIELNKVVLFSSAGTCSSGLAVPSPRVPFQTDTRLGRAPQRT